MTTEDGTKNVRQRVVRFWTSLGGAPLYYDSLTTADFAGVLPSCFPVTDFAASAIATAGLAVAEICAGEKGPIPAVHIDGRAASLWFGTSLRPRGWSLPTPWDPIAGDYQTADGFIRLHTNAPHHRAAAERVLGAKADKTAMAAAILQWQATALEDAIVAAGGCAAEMRDAAAWRNHPQGRAVATEPLVHFSTGAQEARRLTFKDGPAPLKGLRVLDLTRVLAGPVATRFLAGFGAEVLRLDPPGWDEPGVVPDVALGKSCARLDLKTPAGREIFEVLLAGADVLIHGYRPGALALLGYDAAALQRLSPGLIDVSLCAYGWTGPWADRRGFDSLVQMSAGIAAAGMAWKQAAAPVPLPVQALDHGTGYLMAAAALRLVSERRRSGRGGAARLSLARTALELLPAASATGSPPLAPAGEADYSEDLEMTDWGPADRLKPPLSISGADMRWSVPARRLGTAIPAWRT